MSKKQDTFLKSKFLTTERLKEKALYKLNEVIKKAKDKYYANLLVIDSPYYNIHYILKFQNDKIKDWTKELELIGNLKSYQETKFLSVLEQILDFIFFNVEEKVVLEELAILFITLREQKISLELKDIYTQIIKSLEILITYSKHRYFLKIKYFVNEAFSLKVNNDDYLFMHPICYDNFNRKVILLQLILDPEGCKKGILRLSNKDYAAKFRNHFIRMLFINKLFSPYQLNYKKSEDYKVGFSGNGSSIKRITYKQASTGSTPLNNIPENIELLFARYSHKNPWPPTISADN